MKNSTVWPALLLLDVDFVLTDGHAWQNSLGEHKRKFSVRDQLSIKALRKQGTRVAILTSAQSSEIEEFAKTTPVDFLFIDCDDKHRIAQGLIDNLQLTWNQVVGVLHEAHDDKLAQKLGLLGATPSAAPVIRQSAHAMLQSEGGDGVVREFCQILANNAITRVGIAV